MCQRTVIRDGVRVTEEEAARADIDAGDQAYEQGDYDSDQVTVSLGLAPFLIHSRTRSVLTWSCLSLISIGW